MDAFGDCISKQLKMFKELACIRFLKKKYHSKLVELVKQDFAWNY